MRRTALIAVLVLLALTVCGSPPVQPSVNGTIKPKDGQPSFPKLGQYWVIDKGCDFSQETVEWADEVFEQLRQDGIAEVAVICQTGVVDRGPMNNGLIWTRDWGRWARLGDKDDDRAVVWLIRPDVAPEQHRVVVEVSTWLYQYTAIDYGDTLEEAANYANWDDFDGVLEAIARGTDQKLREVVKDNQIRK